jgi:XTP/dITP diphosphohydrolase
VEETGETYAENAKIKAVAASLMSGLPALADDSGIEVEALNGRPGVRSARYAGADASDADRRALLLQELHDVPEERRSAAFRCVIAIAIPPTQGGDPEVVFVEGSCEGRIARSERGSGGFGYDPLFFLPELGRTMAELTPEEKNQLSHRGEAARAAGRLLRELAQEK